MYGGLWADALGDRFWNIVIQTQVSRILCWENYFISEEKINLSQKQRSISMLRTYWLISAIILIFLRRFFHEWYLWLYSLDNGFSSYIKFNITFIGDAHNGIYVNGNSSPIAPDINEGALCFGLHFGEKGHILAHCLIVPPIQWPNLQITPKNSLIILHWSL